MKFSNKQIGLLRATDFSIGHSSLEFILIKKKKIFMTKPAALKRGRLLCTKPTKPLFTKNLNLFFSRKKRKKKKKPMNEMYVCMYVLVP